MTLEAPLNPTGQLSPAAATRQAATLLFRRAFELANAGREREGADLFRRAYLLHPSDSSLLTRQFLPGQAAELRDYALGLTRNGVAFSAVVAALAIAEAHLGNDREVRRLVDYDRFFRREFMEPAAGQSLAAFNAALADEIKTDLKYYDEPAERAIRHAWRQDRVINSPLPTLGEWTRNIRLIIERYLSALPSDCDHPFVRSRPTNFVIEGWAVVSDGGSFHRPHIHPRAWLSGVYYLSAPSIARAAGSRIGWLHVGPPEMHRVSGSQGWEERAYAPHAGSLVMMPAYFYHWTLPSGSEEERICLVFDVVPTELKPLGPDSDDD